VTQEAPVRYAGALPATKFALPPEQPTIIVRRRLIDALDAGVERPLTLISAPPGAGKTALLGTWVASGRPPGPVAWLSLDASDAERRRFWRAVLEALRRADAGAAVEALAAHPQSRVDRLLGELVSALEGREEPVVLVLDDFHEVAEAVHGDVDHLLHRPPPGLRVVIATRADPPLRLGRLRVQDQLTEIREPSLALTLEETGQMLAAADVSLPEPQLRRLWDHTEGWAGALRLAALSLRDHPDPGRFVDDFAGDDRAISDYLMSEVMSLLSPDDRTFVLRTSIAGLLNGDLANALTDGTDGHRRLAELARAGALLAPLDRRGEWYRYHALFRELLYAELRSDWPDDVRDLHRRAATWLAENGDDARGLQHAVEARAWDLAARLAGERWVDLLIRGEVGALRPLIERLPAEWTARDPELALAVASAHLDRGDHTAAARLLKSAEAAAEHVPEERQARFAVSFAALALHVSRLRGDLATALETGRALASDGRLEPGVVEPDLRALALTNLGIAELWTGEAEAAGRHLERARGAAAEAGRDWLALLAIAHLAVLAGTVQDFPRSARHARDAIALAQRHGWERTWPAGAAYLTLANAEFLWDRGEDAARNAELAREALHGTQERPLLAGLALLRSGVLGARGELEAALAVVESGWEEIGDWPLPPTMRDYFAVREAILRAELGDRAGAARAVAGDGDGGAPSLAAAVVLAQLQLADGDSEAARKTVGAWSPERESELTPAAVQAWVVEALALDAVADHEGAGEALERALERAEPGGLRWALLAFGRSLAPLLNRQLRRGTAHRALVGELLAALDGANGGRSHSPFVVEPLSPRERAVLRYLPTMMSNQEIASELFVSVNTVKTHLKAIYRKLDVADRREAVSRARALELLAP
jgi:LuxR family transcriptional regulator, maltose regulon positive regulatory protein